MTDERADDMIEQVNFYFLWRWNNSETQFEDETLPEVEQMGLVLC